MKIKYYFIVLILGVFIYFALKPHRFNPSTEANIASVASQDHLVAESLPIRLDNKNLNKKNDNHTSSIKIPAVENFDIDSNLILQKKKQKNFVLFLTMINKCLYIKNMSDSSIYEPKVQNILTSIKNDIGDPVIRSEDWATTETVDSQGIHHLIRVETSYDNDDIVKQLKYFKLIDGKWISIELTDEQSIEPSMALIASLESEGEIFKKQKSERIFFQNGEELVYTETDGIIDSVEFIRKGKVLNCRALSDKPCTCS